MPQLEQFATHPLVAPARMLGRQPQDQVAAGGREQGPPRPAASAEYGPLAMNQFAVPAQEGLRSDGKRVLAGSRETAA
jgi:hypothetical protein